MKKILSLLILLSLLGCATKNQNQPPRISVKLNGTAVEVQNFIEERFRQKNASFYVESATDREIVFKANCMDTPGMNAFKCSLIMMSVGNSGWDWPFSVISFRTSEIRGVVNLTASSKWCATNAFGKTNCRNSGSNAEHNELMRKIETAFQQEIRPLAQKQ